MIGDRIEVIGLAQPLLPQVEPARDARSTRASRLTARTPAGGPAVLAHVRVDEQRAVVGRARDWPRRARRATPAATGARARRATSALLNAPSRQRQAPQIAEHEIGAVDGLAREVRADVDADERRAASSVPRDRPTVAAAEVDDAVAGAERGESAAACRCESSIRAAAARWIRAVRRRAARASRYFVCSANAVARPQVEVPVRRVELPLTSAASGTAARRRDAAPAVRTLHDVEQTCRDHQRPIAASTASSRSARRAHVYSRRERASRVAERGASAGSAARRSSAFASAAGSPGGTSRPLSRPSAPRAAPADRRRRWAGQAGGTRTVSAARCSVPKSPTPCWAGRASSRCARCPRHRRLGQESRHLHAIGHTDVARELLDARAIGLARMTADDQSPNARRQRERPHEHVDTLPRIEVARIAGHGRRSITGHGGHGIDRHARRRVPRTQTNARPYRTASSSASACVIVT